MGDDSDYAVRGALPEFLLESFRPWTTSHGEPSQRHRCALRCRNSMGGQPITAPHRDVTRLSSLGRLHLHAHRRSRGGVLGTWRSLSFTVAAYRGINPCSALATRARLRKERGFIHTIQPHPLSHQHSWTPRIARYLQISRASATGLSSRAAANSTGLRFRSASQVVAIRFTRIIASVRVYSR